MAQFDEITELTGKLTESKKSFRIVKLRFGGIRIGKAHDTGFTLVEVIASLLIVGILGAIAGMGIVTGMRGYMQAKENAHIAQKAQIALTRIKREMMELTEVVNFDDESTDQWIIFDNPPPFGRQAIAKMGEELQLFNLPAGATNLAGASGDILIDQVESFSIVCCKGREDYSLCDETKNEPWKPGEDKDLLASVELNFDVRRKEGREGVEGTVPFSTTITPRNNGNFGGETLSGNDYDHIAAKYQCFITSTGNSSDWLSTMPPKAVMLMAAFFCFFSVAAGAAFSRRSHRSKHRSGGTVTVINDHGNVLVGLVVILLLFAALGAGMVSLIGSSSTSQVTGNTAIRAYYIAESGFRYAASRYLNTTDTNNVCKSQDEKNQTLADLHDNVFTLGGGDDGQFRLKIFPYFLTVNGDTTVGSSTLATQFSGGKPEGFTLPSNGVNAHIKIGNNVYFYSFYNDSSGQLTLSTPLAEDACDNAVVKLIGLPAGSATVTNTGNLTLADGGFFPKVQGRIKINGVAYGYINRDGNVLQNITNVENPDDVFSIAVDTTTEVVMEPFVQVRSIGMVGQGDLAATREVVYNVPIPERPNTIIKEVFYDEFNNDANWGSPLLGGFEVQTFEGNKALAVTSTQSGISSPKAALIPFNWTTTRVNFASAHKSAGRFLSYDSQVKILFDPLLGPGSWEDGNELGTAPDGLPKYFMSGIAFRLDENLNTYGLSLTRGSANIPPTPDNIAQELMPQDQTPMLVLWQNKISDTPAANWLAYGVMPQSIIFSDDMESGTNGWTKNTAAGNEWTLVEYAEDSTLKKSGTHSWTTSPSGSYGDGEDLFLESRRIDLSGFDSAILTFWTRYQINSCSDFGYVEVSTDDGATWNDRLNDRISSQCGGAEPNASSYAHYTGNSENLSGNRDGWVKKTLDLGIILDLAEPTTNLENVRIRFYFNRNNGDANGEGWWVDDVKVTTKEFLDLPSKQATVMVRVFEVAVVRFNSGGTVEIEAGDLVAQPNGALGVVVVPPVLATGTWAGGDATGMLWLNKTSTDEFQVGDNLDVLGKGSNLATVTGYTSRTNLIKAYYNNLANTGEPHNSPYDQKRLVESRGELRWPADEGDLTNGGNDYFTLIEWDVDINRNVLNPDQRLKDENGKYTIIATNSLSTPADTYFPTPLIRPEIGLQAFGHGAVDLYFDDFGLQAYFISGSGFLQPIQQ